MCTNSFFSYKLGNRIFICTNVLIRESKYCDCSLKQFEAGGFSGLCCISGGNRIWSAFCAGAGGRSTRVMAGSVAFVTASKSACTGLAWLLYMQLFSRDAPN